MKDEGHGWNPYWMTKKDTSYDSSLWIVKSFSNILKFLDTSISVISSKCSNFFTNKWNEFFCYNELRRKKVKDHLLTWSKQQKTDWPLDYGGREKNSIRHTVPSQNLVNLSFPTLFFFVRISLKFCLINLKDSATMFWGRLCFKVNYVSW